MKKVFSIFAAIAIFAASATAQVTFKKDDAIVEGTASVSSTTGESTTFSFSPSLGTFLTSKVALGVTGEYTRDQEEQDVVNFGGFLRWYFANVGKNLALYSQVNVGRQNKSFATNVGIGANYFVTSHVALSAQLADLASFRSGQGTSTFTMGFTGINNPLAMSKFGLLVRL